MLISFEFNLKKTKPNFEIPAPRCKRTPFPARVMYLKNKYKVVTEALKLAAIKASENDQNGLEMSKIYHSLIEVMFFTQEFRSPTAEEDNFQMCNKLLRLIENELHDYPELEVLWLMAKCWNWGIRKLAINDSKRAFRWCTLAMAFLEKLDSLKSLHEKKIKDMYVVYFAEQVPTETEKNK